MYEVDVHAFEVIRCGGVVYEENVMRNVYELYEIMRCLIVIYEADVRGI